MAERKIHLSSAQQLEFISVSESITDDELEYYYMLTAEDLQIVGSHRGQENKLGFAMTICCLRHKGWPYLTMESVPDKVIRYVAEQISVDPSAITLGPYHVNGRAADVVDRLDFFACKDGFQRLCFLLKLADPAIVMRDKHDGEEVP